MTKLNLSISLARIRRFTMTSLASRFTQGGRFTRSLEVVDWPRLEFVGIARPFELLASIDVAE